MKSPWEVKYWYLHMQILLKQGSEQKSLVPRTAWILLPSLLPATLVAASVTSIWTSWIRFRHAWGVLRPYLWWHPVQSPQGLEPWRVTGKPGLVNVLQAHLTAECNCFCYPFQALFQALSWEKSQNWPRASPPTTISKRIWRGGSETNVSIAFILSPTILTIFSLSMLLYKYCSFNTKEILHSYFIREISSWLASHLTSSF